MPNDYRKEASSGGRVGYGESVDSKVKKAEGGKLKAERPSFDLSAESGTKPGRADHLKQYQFKKKSEPGEGKPTNVAPHGKRIKPLADALEGS